MRQFVEKFFDTLKKSQSGGQTWIREIENVNKNSEKARQARRKVLA